MHQACMYYRYAHCRGTQQSSKCICEDTSTRLSLPPHGWPAAQLTGGIRNAWNRSLRWGSCAGATSPG